MAILSQELNLDYLETINMIIQLVNNEVVSIQSGDNPHIIRFSHYKLEDQINILDEARKNKTKKLSQLKDVNISFQSHLVCLYPSPSYLKANRDLSDFEDDIYKKRLALGEPHLTPVYFNIEILDQYYRDPRYHFEFDDYSGSISYHETPEGVSYLNDEDKIFLKTFGLGIDENKNRIAVVFLRYLNDLTIEHKTLWKKRESSLECKMLSEYLDYTLGQWGNSMSIFTAFIQEQKLINQLSFHIFGKSLFRESFERHSRPAEFTFFFIPTLKNYQDFILTLDKMISDNINQKFFIDKIKMFELKDEDDMKIKVNKGTLRLLEEWLNSTYKKGFEDGTSDLIASFKKVRKERQKPAHKISKNQFGFEYIELQRSMISEVYETMHVLRVIFSKHPKAVSIETPGWIDSVKIKVF